MPEFNTPRKGSINTHTFILICPKCGHEHKISNAEDTSAISLEYNNRLMFNCKECGNSMPLPFKDFTKDSG